MRRVRLYISSFKFQGLKATLQHQRSRLGVVLSTCFLSMALSGCFLISGQVQSSDSTAEGGNVYVGFVSAEGNDEKIVQTTFPGQELEITVFAQNQRGQLRIEILDEQGSVVSSVEGTAEERLGRGTVQTNANGEFRYRIRATGAQRGSFTILYNPRSG